MEAREAHAVAALKRARFASINHKVKLDGASFRIWTNALPELLAQLGPSQRVQRYEDELAKTEAKKTSGGW
jgi:hypothetical protein